jgi:hypothetical protein
MLIRATIKKSNKNKDNNKEEKPVDRKNSNPGRKR